MNECIRTLNFSKKTAIFSYYLEYGKELYPRHPGLELKYDCEQNLNLRTSRVLLTYEKVKEMSEISAANAAQITEDVYAIRNGFREIYFKPGQLHPKVK